MRTKRKILKKNNLEVKGVKERFETRFSIPKLFEHRREREVIKGPKIRRKRGSLENKQNLARF